MPTFVYLYVQYFAQMHVAVLAVIIVFASSCCMVHIMTALLMLLLLGAASFHLVSVNTNCSNG